MEFEKNKPTTQRDITLANAARVTLQPYHQNIDIDPVSNEHMSSTSAYVDAIPGKTQSQHSDISAGIRHHKFAAIVTLIVTVLLAAGMYWLFQHR
jgi:hypothetical protein